MMNTDARNDRLLRLQEVKERVSLGKSTVYKLIAQQKFPAPVLIGNAARWQESRIQAWIADPSGWAATTESTQSAQSCIN